MEFDCSESNKFSNFKEHVLFSYTLKARAMV